MERKKKNLQKPERWQSRQLPRQLNLQTVLKMPHVVFLITLQDTTLPVGDSSKSLRMLVHYKQIEGFNHTGTAILHRLMRRCDTEGRILESYYVRVINPNCRCFGTVNSFVYRVFAGPSEQTILDALNFATILRG